MLRNLAMLLTMFAAPVTADVGSMTDDSVTHTVAPVIVRASRLSLTAFDLNRSATVLPAEQIRNSSARSLEDVLRQNTAVEIRRRGPFGVQTDIGIRGSTFSQQLVLFNGFRINDPQTAHHNFDIPVPLFSVTQIEIIRGPNSMTYGPDAYGGTINIVAEPQEPMLAAELSGGGFGYGEGNIHVGTRSASLRSLTAAGYKRSDGYRSGTEFDNWNALTMLSSEVPWGTLTAAAGYQSKDFGAFDFYSPGSNIPSHEKTETMLANIGTGVTVGPWMLDGRFGYRRHDDHFIFDVRNPSRSNNRHTTTVMTAELTAVRQWSTELVTSGTVEVTGDRIVSTKLGVHERTAAAASFITRWNPADRWSIDAGIRGDIHSDYASNLHPTVSAGYLLWEQGKLYLSAGTSFRAPSYTDLYYSDPANVGNPQLQPERGRSFESGLHLRPDEATTIQIAGFYREQTDLIDYVKQTPTDLYHARNFSRALVRGIEVQSQWTPDDGVIRSVALHYTHITSGLDIGGAYRTKYSFTHPRHQVNAAFTAGLAGGIGATLSAGYYHHSLQPSYGVLDVTLARTVGPVELLCAATNVLDRSYSDIPGIPMPGRWIIGTVRWTMKETL